MKHLLNKNYFVLLILAFGFLSPVSAQYDLYGLWARKAGVITSGASINVYQTLIANDGSVYVCGIFSGSVSLSDNTCVLLSSRQDATWGDGFVSKYDADGNFVWTVTVASNTSDAVPGMVLSQDGQTLTIMATYANQAYTGVAPGACQITYNNGAVEALPYNQPVNTFGNYALVFINTNDGTQKTPATYLGYAQVTDYFYVSHLSTDAAGNLYVMGEGGSSPRYYRVRKFTGTGTVISTTDVINVANNDIHSNYASKNPNAANVYIQAQTSYDNNVTWGGRVYKINRANPATSTYLSSTSSLQPLATRLLGIYDTGLDVNNAETHLFMAGYTNQTFTYVSTGANITNSGGMDGIIVCYDPQNTNGATNMRWMVNLRAAGNQMVADCQFDEATQTLRAVGYIDTNPVNFNPLGAAMTRQSTVGTSMFYAVYNMNGICLKADVMNNTGSDAAQKLNLSGDKTAIFGTFSGSPFQPDPSNRLRPLRTSANSAFLAKYTTDPLSAPVPERVASYSSANNVKASYGLAFNEVMSCLRLGNLNNAIDKLSASVYVPKNAPGVAGSNPNHDGLNSVLVNTPAGGITVKLNALNSKNSPAYMAGWIDFNGNGVFDPGEVSGIVTVPANTNTLTAYNLVWTSFPTVTKANMETMLRVRLTSETLDGTWATDYAVDGETEDYTLSLNLLNASKTAVISKPLFSVGDTVTYTLSITSQINNVAVTVFDPIPENTTYVAGSANPTTGSLTAVSLQGQNLNAIRWSPLNFVAGTTQTFSFKAVITGYPPDNYIANVGYAVMNGDTIPTTGANCDRATVWGNPLTDDYATTLINMPVKIDVLANDRLSNCPSPILTIKTPSPDGVATVNQSGDSIIFTPAAGFLGLTQFEYEVDCNGYKSTAKVTVRVLELPDNIVDANCYINRPSGAWSIKQRFVSNTVAGGDVFEMSVPLVGDIDGDGIVEIVVAGKSTATNNFNCDSIKVFDGLHNTVKNKFKVETFHGGFGTIAMADVDKDGFAEIFVATNFAASAGNQGYIMCYRYDGTLKWKSAAVYTANATTLSYPYLKITDFNSDGIPEIMANDRIFNAVTGDLLLDCGLIAGGLDYGTGGGHNSYYPTGYFGNFSSAADMDGDALPEIVAGRNIYKININSLTNPALNSCTLLRSAIPGTHSTDLGDGYTSVADLNLDGTPDVIVIRQNPAARATKYLYAWDGKTGEMLHTNIITLNDGNGSYGGSIPFVGDLDGDGTPEISFTLTSRLHAYKLNKNAKTLNPMAWSPLSTTDISGATTLTLFDFNQDNQMELVYRDQDNLRIIDGATGLNKTTIPCFSWTMNEYPVVADVTGNGHANIVVLGKPAAASHGNGYLYVFEHDLSVPGAIPWAPTRKVWNQWAYNVVNINEDLTVPKYLMNPATVFPGTDGIFGTADDVRPYNGFLMQQTIIDKQGVPLWLAPDVYTTLPLVSTTASGDSVIVTVKVVNQGDASIGSPVYATLYKKKTPQTFTPADTIATGRANIQILPGETGIVTITIPNITPFLPQSSIVVRVNDNGLLFPVELECDITNDTLSIMAAVCDYAETIREIPVTIDVLDNDILNLCPTVVPSILTPPPSSTGSVIVSGNKIIFTAAFGFTGKTEFIYQITCNGQISTAKVVVTVKLGYIPVNPHIRGRMR